jgi:anti-anti-sigma regulatory factor
MTISLIPDRDGECAFQLRAALRGASGDSITIDLRHVSYLSSTALVELMTFRRHNDGVRIVLLHPNALIVRTLSIVGATRCFVIEGASTERIPRGPRRKRHLTLAS